MKCFFEGIIACLLFSAFAVEPYSREDYESGRKRLEEMSRVKYSRTLDKPVFFVRTQTKYSGRLQMSRYDFEDRPLFNSRTYPVADQSHNEASFARNLELYKLTGLNGICTFAWYGPHQYKSILSPLFRAAAKSSLHTMLEFYPANLEVIPETLKLITDSPNAFIFNGKRIISSYVADGAAPEKWEAALKKWNAAASHPVGLLPQFYFCRVIDANGKMVNGYEIADIYRKHRTLPLSLISSIERYLRRFLEFSEGIYLATNLSTPDLRRDPEYFDKALVPIVRSVLSEEPYRNKKLFAIQGEVGYTCYAGVQTLLRDGTATLRSKLNTMRTSEADIFIGCEWDELNEDTGFEPLVSKPMSTARIMRRFLGEMRGEKVAQIPGDDLSLPDLIVSFRRQILPGTAYHIELLNVPDPDRKHPYKVKLELLDENGKALYPARDFTFDPAKWQEKTLRLPTEPISFARVIRPRVTIAENGKKRVIDAFPFTILRTVTADQHYFCMPVRNILIPEKSDIRFDKDQLQCRFDASDRNINTAEVVQDQIEIFAYDRANEFLQNDPERQLFYFRRLAYNPPPRLMADVEITVENAPSLAAFINDAPDISKPLPQLKAFPKQSNVHIGWYDVPRHYFSIKKAELSNAVFHVKITRRSGKLAGKSFEWRVPLKDFGRRTLENTVSDDGITLTLETGARPSWQPLPVGKGKLDFTADIPFDSRNSVSALRIISIDGKVFWSAPYVRRAPETGKKVPYCAYSETAKKYVTIPLDESRIPDLNYDLSDRFGYIIGCPEAGRSYFAMAGSYLSVATGFEGAECNVSPFHVMFKSGALKGIASRPKRIGNKLYFDGKSGNYLIFPKETLPQGAGFTLSFTITPETLDNDPVLLENGPDAPGGMLLEVRGGQLLLKLLYRAPGRARDVFYKELVFPTGLTMRSGVEQKITVTYDGHKLIAAINDKAAGCAIDGAIAIYNQYTNFGGKSPGRWFGGTLSSFEVKHYPTKIEGIKEMKWIDLTKKTLLPIITAAEIIVPATAMSMEITKADWTPSIQRILQDKGNGVFAIDRRANMTTEKLIAVEPGKTYTLSGEVRNGSDRPGNAIGIGWEIFNEQKVPLRGWMCRAVAKSSTTLAAPVKKGDTQIKIADGKNWQLLSWTWLQWNLKDDLADLPTNNCVQIKSVAKDGAGLILTLMRPFPEDLPAGTAVRQAPRSDMFRGFPNLVKLNGDWQKFTLTLSGISKDGIHLRQWWPGTRYCRVVLMANLSGNKPVLEFRNLKIEIK
ncbi:MAG: hypothetical protein IKC82_01845 [Lentisphaeria bacterium]|nr:hypothetical protein [Lentisphaeria bacterium]